MFCTFLLIPDIVKAVWSYINNNGNHIEVQPEWTEFRELNIKINSYTGIDYTCDWNPGPSKQPNN